MMNSQHLDYDALNALKDIMEDNFTFLIETFIQDSTERLSQLQLMVNASDVDGDAIRRAAHSFKGSCGNIGAPYLASLCSLVENKIVNSRLDGLANDVHQIQNEFSIVKNSLMEYLS